jgi:23S rRNA (adenine2503-C2)-methyltransferase
MLTYWNDIKRIDSSESSVCKFVYTKDNAVAESVLYKYPDYATRTVICCSTQSGCPVGCRFCGAGDAFVRSLTADEIVEQVDYSIGQTGVDPLSMGRLQIMFMSMGEPLLNFKNLEIAIRVLYSKYPNAALLISTIGPDIDYDPLRRLSIDVPTVGLQFSVHKSTDEERNKLIPFKAKLSLNNIGYEGFMWRMATGRKPFFNYCAADDNTSDEDVARLQAQFDPNIWECTISVICERNEGLPAKNDHQRELATNFSSKMLDAGYNVRVFDPAGQDDVGGGCGQLWFVQQWMKDNPELVRPSVGAGLPILHTPCGACP